MMASHLFDAKLLSEPMMTYCHLEVKQQTSVKFESKDNNLKFLIQETEFENVICKNSSHFVLASMCQH